VSETPDELEREETMSDLDVPEAEAEDVKGGLIDKTSRAFKYDTARKDVGYK
jgi:hypothetical protein